MMSTAAPQTPSKPVGRIVTRFAPSPTGLLHKGHGLSALIAHGVARRLGGDFLLRIEDIDAGRCRPEFAAALERDLTWLGLDWRRPPMKQSDRFGAYAAALDRLKADGLLYPCFCTRREIREEIARSPSAPHGPDGPLYPGTCRFLSHRERTDKLASGMAHAWRLDVRAATDRLDQPLAWDDLGAGIRKGDPECFGDVVLARKDTPTSYHLAVVVDDAAQGVNLVTRGRDLFEATHVHVLLQRLLDLPTPRYFHHDLLTDDDGRRLAKRDKSATLETMRARGISAEALSRDLAPMVEAAMHAITRRFAA